MFVRHGRQIRTVILAGFVVVPFFLVSGPSAEAQLAGQRVYPWRANLRDDAGIGRDGKPVPPALATGRDKIRLFQASTRRQDPAGTVVGGQGATQQDPATQNGAQGGSVRAQLSDDVPGPPASIPTPEVEQRPSLSVTSNARPDLDRPGEPKQDWCRIGEVRRVFPTTVNGLSVGGFNQIGYHTRDLLSFNHREDKLNQHQNWVYIDQAANPCAGRNFGFRIDGLYGLDAQEIQAIGNSPTGAPTGWDNSWDNGSFGFALPQAYVEYATEETTLRLGKFLSPIGFESVPSVENFFYSRSYARTFTEPFTHTGLLVQRSVQPGLTTFGGVTAGWNSAFENTDNGFNLLTGFNYCLSDKVTVGMASSLGDTGYRGSGVLQTANLQVQVTEKILWGIQGDFLNLQTNDEIGFTNYVFYCQNRCLSFGSRLEWWKSDQFGGGSASTWGVTNGINWRPHANVVIRPEVRVDGGAAALTPGDPIAAIDAVILF